MSVLLKGNSLYPFWGDTVNLITGLDPLGLQVTSEATYSVLLPGISNLTNRLRYYGFYCWLLDFYFKNEKHGNQTEQYRFIRRAELLIAIIMQSERTHVSQITGSDFAAYLVKETNTRVYDLKAGADKDSKNEAVYWKYPSGAFGQYYFGAMHAMALTVRYENKEGDIIFNITQPNPRQKVSGQQLADAFDEKLPARIKSLFLECIKKGKLPAKDIPDLVKYFAIDKVNPKSIEWQLYTDMLLDKDYPGKEVEEEFSFHRQRTIQALVSNAAVNNNDYIWRDYLVKCYEQKFTDADTTTIGWYCYQLNEYWQFACGIIFYAALMQLESLHKDQYLPKYINDFATKISKEFDTAGKITVRQYLESLPTQQTEQQVHENFTENKNFKPHQDARLGFDLLFYLYNNNKDHLHQLKEYMSRNSMIRDGNMADGLLSLGNCLESDLGDFIANFLHKDIIYRHQMVALRKMGNSTQCSNKFVIEEQMIRLIDIFPARWTSPRMNALKNLLADLQVINDEAGLTPLHSKLITN